MRCDRSVRNAYHKKLDSLRKNACLLYVRVHGKWTRNVNVNITNEDKETDMASTIITGILFWKPWWYWWEVLGSYAVGCEPPVTGDLAMGLTIRSSHKQELSSVYQFIDVLYSLCIYEALRHWSLSCPPLLTPQVREWVSLALYLCRAIYTKLVAIRLATIGRRYYWSHTLARSVGLYTGECVVDSSTGLWDRAVLLYPV